MKLNLVNILKYTVKGIQRYIIFISTIWLKSAYLDLGINVFGHILGLINKDSLGQRQKAFVVIGYKKGSIKITLKKLDKLF